MLDRQTQRLMQEEERFFGIKQGFKQFTPYPFAGMSQKSTTRQDGKDQEWWWSENFVKTGDGCMRTLWDEGTALYTASGGKTIIYAYFFNIGQTDYVAVFLSDGTAYQIDMNGNSATISSSSHTFYNSSISTQLPVCSQWGSEYLIIANNFTSNAYWIWDGAILYSAGSLSPIVTLTNVGAGYSSVPTVTAFGGAGSGATFSASFSGGSLTNIAITNAGSGYNPGDQVQLYITGGGSDSGFQLTAVLASGTIESVVITDAGSGYTAGTYNLGFSGGGGSGVTGTYTVGSGGTVTSTSITAAGSGYTSQPTITFPTPVGSLNLTAGGSGYTDGTYSLGFSGGGGSGATGTYTCSGGAVTSVSLTAGGTGYTSAPTVSFPSGGGSGATATASLAGSGASGFAVLNPGSVASVTVTHGGTNLTGTPTLTFSGGGGSGATATANVSGGAITSVTVTNGGKGYTTTPAVIVQTGLNNAAAATVTLMPYGISGTSMETFQSRVWLCYPYQTGSFTSQGTNNGDVMLISAPGSVSNFATSAGGDVFNSTDSFLRKQFVNIKQSNGYLYPIGDSSVSVISNVQTSGSPATTTFNYQNTDPQIGASWRDSVQVYSRTILFANPIGAYGLYGGAASKISANMDNIFNNAILPASGGVTPSSAVANIYGTAVYLLNMTITDPFTSAQRTVMLAWDQKGWYIASQSSSLTFIATQEVSSNLTAWGTDGTSLFKLFSTPSTSLTKKLSSKLYGQNDFLIQKESMGIYVQAQDLSGGNGISLATLAVDSETGSYNVPSIPTLPTAKPPQYAANSIGSGDVFGSNLGVTLTTTAKDMSINYLALGYVEVGSAAMGSTPIQGTLVTE